MITDYNLYAEQIVPTYNDKKFFLFKLVKAIIQLHGQENSAENVNIINEINRNIMQIDINKTRFLNIRILYNDKIDSINRDLSLLQGREREQMMQQKNNKEHDEIQRIELYNQNRIQQIKEMERLLNQLEYNGNLTDHIATESEINERVSLHEQQQNNQMIEVEMQKPEFRQIANELIRRLREESLNRRAVYQRQRPEREQQNLELERQRERRRLEHERQMLGLERQHEREILALERQRVRQMQEHNTMGHEQLPVHHSGIAFEVHNAFNEFKFDNFIKIITEKNETNKAPINNEDPLTPLIEYMASNKISQDKITQLTTIKTTLDSFSTFISHKKDIANVIKYVLSQSTEFINIYIDNFIQDCLHAYSSNNSASCTKGMYERIFTVFRDVISTLCTEEITGNSTAITTSTCKPEYIELFNCFYNIPSLNEMFQEWYNIEEAKKEVDNKEKRIERFKNFVKEKMPENKYNLILSKLEKYIEDNSSIFETMMLGGRKRGGGKPRISLSAAKKRKSKKKKSKKTQTRRMK